MQYTTSSPTSCDLLSNFVTCSYLQILEYYLLYSKHPSHKSYKKKLLQAISSYLFVIEHDTTAYYTLDQHVFNHFIIPSPEESSFFFKKNTSLTTLKKNYNKKRLSLVTHSLDTLALNKLFIHTYRRFIFNNYPSQALIPQLFTHSCAKDFTSQIYQLKKELSP